MRSIKKVFLIKEATDQFQRYNRPEKARKLTGPIGSREKTAVTRFDLPAQTSVSSEMGVFNDELKLEKIMTAVGMQLKEFWRSEEDARVVLKRVIEAQSAYVSNLQEAWKRLTEREKSIDDQQLIEEVYAVYAKHEAKILSDLHRLADSYKPRT